MGSGRKRSPPGPRPVGRSHRLHTAVHPVFVRRGNHQQPRRRRHGRRRPNLSPPTPLYNHNHGLGFVVRVADRIFYAAAFREGGGMPRQGSAARGLAGAGRDWPSTVAVGKGIGKGGGDVSRTKRGLAKILDYKLRVDARKRSRFFLQNIVCDSYFWTEGVLSSYRYVNAVRISVRRMPPLCQLSG